MPRNKGAKAHEKEEEGGGEGREKLLWNAIKRAEEKDVLYALG